MRHDGEEPDVPAPSLIAPAELRQSIENELSAHFADRTAAAEAYGREFSLLWQHAARHALGGKLVRPVLLVETYDALEMPRCCAMPLGVATIPRFTQRIR